MPQHSVRLPIQSYTDYHLKDIYIFIFQITELSHLPTLSYPVGMTMDEQYFYLTNNKYYVQEVYQVDKATGTKVKTVYSTGYSELGDLHVYKNITPPESKLIASSSIVSV